MLYHKVANEMEDVSRLQIALPRFWPSNVNELVKIVRPGHSRRNAETRGIDCFRGDYDDVSSFSYPSTLQPALRSGHQPCRGKILPRRPRISRRSLHAAPPHRLRRDRTIKHPTSRKITARTLRYFHLPTALHKQDRYTSLRNLHRDGQHNGKASRIGSTSIRGSY